MAFLSYVLAILLAMVVDANRYWIEPKTVSLSARKVWCADQVSSCPLICKQNSSGAFQNTCDPKTLAFSCICDDMTQPNMSEYSVTMPFHMCLEWTNQCAEECPDHDAICQTKCREDHPCGAQNPKRVKTTSAAKATKTADKTIIYDGPKAKEDKNDGEDDEVDRIHDHDGDEAGAMILRSEYMSLPMLIGGLFLGFALL